MLDDALGRSVEGREAEIVLRDFAALVLAFVVPALVVLVVRGRGPRGRVVVLRLLRGAHVTVGHVVAVRGLGVLGRGAQDRQRRALPGGPRRPRRGARWLLKVRLINGLPPAN